MSDIEYTPVMVEQRLRRLLNQLSEATRIQDEAYGRFLGAKRAFDVADQGYRYARSRLEMLKIQIMGVQTIGKSVATAYGAIGMVEP